MLTMLLLGLGRCVAGKYSGSEVRYGEPGELPDGAGNMYRAFADGCINCPSGVCHSIKQLVCAFKDLSAYSPHWHSPSR